jgi:hypothetical protein
MRTLIETGNGGMIVSVEEKSAVDKEKTGKRIKVVRKKIRTDTRGVRR